MTYYRLHIENQAIRDANVSAWVVDTTQLDTALSHLAALLKGEETTPPDGPFDSITVLIDRTEP